MSVGKLVLGVLLLASTYLSASQLGAIGYVSPNYPPYGKYRPSQDTAEFFDDFMEMAFDNYGDAAVSVINRLNLKRNSIRHHDMVYKGDYLIPSEENQDNIEAFYKKKSRSFLKDIARKNKVDVVLYSNFVKSKFKKVFKQKKQQSITELTYQIFVFNVQSAAYKSQYFKIEVEDLFDAPDYDAATIQAKFEDNYIKVFQQILGLMQTTGSAYSGSEPVTYADTSSSSSYEEPKVDRKQEQIEAAAAASGGDW